MLTFAPPPSPPPKVAALRVGRVVVSLVALLVLSSCNDPAPEVRELPAPQEAPADAWARHPMVQLRETLPAGTRFEQVEQIEGFSSDGEHFQQLVVHDGVPPALPFGLSPFGSTTSVSDDLTNAIEQAEPEALLPIVVWLRTDRPWEEASATGRVERALFDGALTNDQTYLDTRMQALDERKATATAWADRFFAEHPQLQPSLAERAGQAPLLALTLTPSQARTLLDDPAVASMELDEGAATADATMVDAVNNMGVKPFLDMGYDAGTYRWWNTSPIELAQIEEGVPWALHPGFNTGSWGGRRVYGYDCTGSTSCTRVSPTAADVPLDAMEDEHATAVAGILAGDNTHDQDPIVSTGFDLTGNLAGTLGYPALQDMYRVRHSGIARQVILRSYTMGRGTSATTRLGRAFDTMAQQYLPSPIANMSASWDRYRTRFWWQPDVPNPTCTETSAMVRLVNTYYEDGGLFVKSA